MADSDGIEGVQFIEGRQYAAEETPLIGVVDQSALDVLSKLDSDGDGVPDQVERQIGTDPNDPNYQSPFDPPNADDYPGGPDWDDRHPEGPQASDEPPEPPSLVDQIGVIERNPGSWNFGDGSQDRAADLERSQQDSGPPPEPPSVADQVGVIERNPGSWNFDDGSKDRAADLERSQQDSGDPPYDTGAVMAKPELTDVLADKAVISDPVEPPEPEPDPLGDAVLARDIDVSSATRSADDEPDVG